MSRLLFGVVNQIGWLIILIFCVTVKLLNKNKRPDYIPQGYRGMTWLENANSWWFVLKAVMAMGVLWTLFLIAIIVVLKIFGVE